MFLTHATSAVDAISMYFPSDCVNGDTFPRSCGGLVISWTNLVSPRFNLESLVLRSPIYYRSVTVTVARPVESWNPAAAEPPSSLS